MRTKESIAGSLTECQAHFFVSNEVYSRCHSLRKYAPGAATIIPLPSAPLFTVHSLGVVVGAGELVLEAGVRLFPVMGDIDMVLPLRASGGLLTARFGSHEMSRSCPSVVSWCRSGSNGAQNDHVEVVVNSTEVEHRLELNHVRQCACQPPPSCRRSNPVVSGTRGERG